MRSSTLINLLPFLALGPAAIQAITCVQFDTSWNLYAFGGSQDVNLGQSSSWAQPSAKPLSTSGRPPWTGNNTQCFLSQFNNAMYVLGGDSSDFSKVYVYNFGSDSWSTQSTSSAPTAQLTRSASILDHDTNVIFTFTNGGLTQLDLSSITSSASGSALPWEGVSAPSWGTGYSGSATAGQASNHVMYFGVPNTAAGSAQVFVVHYAYFQPQAQSFPSSSGSSFPDSAGQAVPVPSNGDNAPASLIFVPSDLSSTYLIDHWTNPSTYSSTDGSPYSANLINTTQTLPAPSGQDAQAAYAASPSSLVQITTGGDIYYIANAFSNGQVSSGASWSKLGYSLSGASGGSGSSASASAGSSSTLAGASASASAGAGASSSRASGTASGASGAASSAAAAAASSSRAAGQRGADVIGVKGLMGLAGLVGAVVAGGIVTLA